MPEIKYLILTSGKFHYFDIAKVLYERNKLYKIVSGYPWLKIKKEKIPKKFVECIGRYQIINYFLRKIPYFNSNKLIDDIDYINKKKIDTIGLDFYEEVDILISSAQSGLNSGKNIKKESKIYVCDQSSPHIIFENKILEQEYKSLSYNKFLPTDNRMLDLALKEYEESDIILTPSMFVKSTFNENFHSKIFVNRLGINTNDFFPINFTQNEKQSFDIIYIGAISIRKGIHYLIDAFNKIKNPKKKLHLIGSHVNNDKEFFEKKINKSNIINYGHVHNLKLNKILNFCDVLVLPSISDGYGMVVNQAAASGCPIIVTENCGSSEFVTENNCGYVVPARDSNAIFEKLSLLIDDKNLLKELSENAKNSSKNITWENYVDKLEKFLILFKNKKN